MDPGKEEQEDEEKMEISQGVLSHLESLERRERGRAELREQQERDRERAELLRARVRELRERRDSLRLKLEVMAQGESGIPWDPRDVVHWRIRELRELLSLYPLTGISGKLSRPGLLSVSLHTSCQGCLLDPFHLELLGAPKSPKSPKSRECQGWEWRLGRHSVPPFVPLGALARQLLPHRPRELLGLLWQHLGACAARREQLRALQEEFPECLQGVPCSNSLCNLLSFHCRIPGKNHPQNPGKNSQNPGKNPPQNPGKQEGIPGKIPGNVLEFRARLRYGDPLRSLPTDVEISAQGGSAPPPGLFRSLSLPRALRALADGNSREILEFPTGTG